MKIRIPSFREYLIEADASKKDQKSDDINTEVQVGCTIALDDVFIKLHDAAKSKCDKKWKIGNSAFTEDGKKLISAGHHVISVAAPEGKIDKETAIAELKKYVHWFSGPDLESKVTEDTVWPLPDSEEGKKEDGGEDNKGGKDKDSDEDAKNESVYIPSFTQYLLTEADPTKAGEDPDGPDQEDADRASAAADAEAESSGAAEEKKEDKKDDGKAQEDGKESARGYYITYELKIKGQKETPLKDALKSMAVGFLKGLGVQSFDWKSGSLGKEHTIGDLLDSLDKVFGKINPEEFKQRFAKNFKQKYQKAESHQEFFDRNTLVQHTKTLLDTKQKTKVKSADYSFCVRVAHTDLSQKLINPIAIADLATRSIKGIFKKFKNKVSADDVVFVNNYNTSDNEKKFEEKVSYEKAKLAAKEDRDAGKTKPADKGHSEKKPSKNTGPRKVNSSIDNPYYVGQLLFEEGEPDADSSKSSDSSKEKTTDNTTEVQNTFESEAKNEFGDKLIAAKYTTAEELKKYLDDHNADSSSFKMDREKNGYLIDLIYDEAVEEKQNESIKLSKHDILSMLFEDVGDGDDIEDRDPEDQESPDDSTDSGSSDDAAEESPADSSDDETPDNDNFGFEDQVKSFFKKAIEAIAKALDKSEDIKTDVEVQKSKYENADESMSRWSLQRILFEELIVEAAEHKGVPEIISIIKRVGVKNINENKAKIFEVVKSFYGGNTPAQKEIKKQLGTKNSGSGLFYEFFELKTDDEMISWVEKKFKDYKKSKDIGPLAQGFWKCLNAAGLPDRKDDEPATIDINFYDADPETNEKTGDPLNKEPMKLEKGQPIAASDDITTKMDEFGEELKGKVKEGFSYQGWNVDPSTALDDNTDVIAQYLKDKDKDKEFSVTFQYAPDQTKEDDLKEIETQKVKAGESAKEPEKPKVDGYKFEGWDKPFDKVISDIKVTAKFRKLKKFHEVYIAEDLNDFSKGEPEKKDPVKLTFKAPDPEKPDQLKPIGEPVPWSEDVEYPGEDKLPKIEGKKFKQWNPLQEELRKKEPETDQDVIAEYEDDKKEKDGKDDESGNTVERNNGKYDFYIIPMKGLKMENTDDDDEKEYSGKGK